MELTEIVLATIGDTTMEAFPPVLKQKSFLANQKAFYLLRNEVTKPLIDKI